MVSGLKFGALPLVIFSFLGTFFCPHVFAAVEESGLQIDGNPVSIFGQRACKTPTAKVNIKLPQAVLNTHSDFIALFSPVKKSLDNKPKAESVCDATIDPNRTKEKFSKSVPELGLKAFLPESACQKAGDSGNRVLCIYDESGKTLLSFALYSYQTTVAKVKDIKNRSALNGTVSFEIDIEGGTGKAMAEVCFGKTVDGKIDDPGCPTNFKRSGPHNPAEVVITDLENGVEYAFKVRLLEGPGDDAEWSTSFVETPVRAASPLGSYDGDGSPIQWNCRQSSGSSIFFLALALLVLMLVRNRNSFLRSLPKFSWIALFALVSIMHAEESHADAGQMNIGILGAMYRPDLDNEVAGSGKSVFPFYKCYFRRNLSDENGPINPLMGTEIDWHLWDGFGSLQLGFGLSYTYARGNILKVDKNNRPDCDSPVENSKVSLHMYQVRPQLTYIFNPFIDYFPIAPYVRSALISHGYMFFSNGKSDSEGSVKPNGLRFGWQAALGAMIMLDFLEPGAVRSASGAGLFNHVYLKGELSLTKIDDFGQPGFQFSAKDVMGTDWPLMWTFGLVFELP